MHSVILFYFNRAGIGGWRLLAETIESRLFLIAGYGSYNPLVVMKTPHEIGAEIDAEIGAEIDAEIDAEIMLN